MELTATIVDLVGVLPYYRGPLEASIAREVTEGQVKA